MVESTTDKLQDFAAGANGLEAVSSPVSNTVPGKKRRFSRIGKIVSILLALSIVANAALVARYLWKKAQYDDLVTIFASEYYTFPSLTVDGFQNKVASGDEFIAFISRPNCSSCRGIARDFTDFCQSAGIEDKIHYVNVVYLHSNTDDWNAFKERYQLTGTPSFVRVRGGEVTSVLSWTAERGCTIEMIKSWMEEQSDFWGI